jgi:bacillithiol biosynthesis cysteine-adding enzyme BshC
LAAAGLLPPIPKAWLEGRDLDLLTPVRFLEPGTLPLMPEPPAVDRRDLARGLAVANRAYGNPNADRLAERLADPSVRVVIAGQQPGLFGGPLYSFTKMLAAARWAAALEAAGQPAVAVFWVATEDHDWAEVSKAVVLAKDGPLSFDLGPDPEPLTPVGMRTLGPQVEAVLQGMADAVPSVGYADWVGELGRWYRPDARFGEAFCRLMATMLGEHCPLLLDAMLPELKAAQRPWLRRLVERRVEVEAALAGRDAEIERRGYPLQVSPQRGASPLFLLHRGERRRIEWRGDDRFALRGREDGGGSVADLLAIIDENPGIVSPGVLARPAVQDAVLGTCLHLLGPGEMSYMAQGSAVHGVLEVTHPFVGLRPQTLVLEAHQKEKMEEMGISLDCLLGDRHCLDKWLAAGEGGGDFVAPIRQRLEGAMADLREPALAADPNLERPFEKTREQVLRAVDLFAEKAMAAAARRNEVANRRAYQLRDLCAPFGKPQERTVAAAHFQGKYGDRFAASYWEQLDLDPTHLRLISP